jgi:ABC-type Mn2+/Zn2+ transport system ATPase subunit
MTILKDLYKQAELETVQSTLVRLNAITRHFLDVFFPEEPCRVSLFLEEKSVKKGRETEVSRLIQTTVEYKGNVYPSIHELSGGELDRCNLASICSVHTMMESPFLLLDESLSSLDATTNTEILGFLKEWSTDKLVLVCSHEAVRGIFDTIIESGNDCIKE